MTEIIEWNVAVYYTSFISHA